MEMNGGFLVTKIKQLGDRIFEKICGCIYFENEL